MPMPVMIPTLRPARFVRRAKAHFSPDTTNRNIRRLARGAGSDPAVWLRKPKRASVKQSGDLYEIMVPISGVDPKKVYIFATEQSIQIEVRVKSSLHHWHGPEAVAEDLDQRVSRELRFPTEIVRGLTTVRISGDCLRITAVKSSERQHRPWSEFVHFGA